MTPARVLVVGSGSAGTRHLHNVRTLFPAVELIWLRRRPPEGSDLPAGVTLARDLAGIDLASLDAAIIAGPATRRVQHIVPLAGRGVPLLVEKPLAATMPDARQIAGACQSGRAPLRVGYHLRCAASLAAVRAAIEAGRVGAICSLGYQIGQWLPDWRPSVDYRETVSARRALGGGVLLELSRACDCARWLAGEVEAVCAVVARSGTLEIDVEDLVEIIVRFRSGAVGSLHLDMLDREYNESCRVVGAAGSIAWDGRSHQALLATGRSVEILHPRTRVDRNDLFRTELQRFFDDLERGTASLADLTDGVRALAIVDAARLSMAEARWVRLPDVG